MSEVTSAPARGLIASITGSLPMVLTSSEDYVPTGVIPIVRPPPYHSPEPTLHQASPQSSPEVRHRCCCLPRTSSSTDIITAVRPPTVTAFRTVIASLIITVSAECHCSFVTMTHCRHSLTRHQDPCCRLHRRSDTVCTPTWLRTESARLPHQNPHSITSQTTKLTPHFLCIKILINLILHSINAIKTRQRPYFY